MFRAGHLSAACTNARSVARPKKDDNQCTRIRLSLRDAVVRLLIEEFGVKLGRAPGLLCLPRQASKYDDEGFVIRHRRAVVPRNTLACHSHQADRHPPSGSAAQAADFA